MRNKFHLLAVAAVLAALASGCANMENKLGRGIANTGEIIRGGEFRRSMEQESLFGGGYTTGLVRGFNRTLARTGIGLYEIVSFPFPPYGPVFTDHFTPKPGYPDNFPPRLVADSMFDADTSIGFSGLDVIPIVPGSRFRVFETF
jgi:putative exosortase-associated protein (TIGR04073 family)